MGLRNLAWPEYVSPNPSGIARFGRFLHWISVPPAILFSGTGLYAAMTVSEPNPSYYLLALVGLPILLAGRGARYILSNE